MAPSKFARQHEQLEIIDVAKRIIENRWNFTRMANLQLLNIDELDQTGTGAKIMTDSFILARDPGEPSDQFIARLNEAFVATLSVVDNPSATFGLTEVLANALAADGITSDSPIFEITVNPLRSRLSFFNSMDRDEN